MSNLKDPIEQARSFVVDGIIRGRDLPPRLRTKLVKARILQPIIKGWYVWNEGSASEDRCPVAPPVWSFLRHYLASFGNYCLGPELSLALRFRPEALPPSTTVYIPAGGNNRILCRFGKMTWSVLLRGVASVPVHEEWAGLTVMPPGYAISSISPKWFAQHSDIVSEVFRQTEAADLAEGIIAADNRLGAHRIIDALQSLGLNQKADQVATLAGIPTRQRSGENSPPLPSSAQLLELRWRDLREKMARHFSNQHRDNPQTQIRRARTLIEYDTYHSLSLAGWDVTPGQIESVSQGIRPRSMEAATISTIERYLLLHEMMLDAAVTVADDSSVADTINNDFPRWSKTWQTDRTPSSQGTPQAIFPDAETLRTFTSLLSSETSGAVSAVLSHLILFRSADFPGSDPVLARLVSNFISVSTGYPWTIIRVAQRFAYERSVDRALDEGDIVPLASLLSAERNTAWD